MCTPAGRWWNELTSINYRDVRGVKEHLGWLESKLALEVSGTTIQLTSMRRKAARAAADAVRRHAPVDLMRSGDRG